MTLEQWRDSQWVPNWGSLNQACLSPPIVILPGAVYMDTLLFWGAEPGKHAGPEFATSQVEGLYRLVWNTLLYHYDYFIISGGEEVPAERRASNSFVFSKRSGS